MSKDTRNQTFTLTITTLTPLHIGTGRELLRDYDYVTHRGGTWVINEDALAESLIDADGGSFERMVQGAAAADLLDKRDFKEDSPLFRYVLRGEPASNKRGSVVQEQIKDAWDRPYIPGSSLKGALRTGLLFIGWQQRGEIFSIRNLEGSAKFAAQQIEHKILVGANTSRGKAPNHDLLRALQVADSTPNAEHRLQLVNVRVTKGTDTKGAPIELEAIPKDVTFVTRLALDYHLLNKAVREQLNWGKDQRNWLTHLPQVMRAWTSARLEAEKSRTRVGAWGAMFQRIGQEQSQLADNEFIVQLGWGGGWDSKTLGERLTSNQDEFARLVNDRKYGMLRQGRFAPGDRYPKSRRVVISRKTEQPASELGWIKVKMEALP